LEQVRNVGETISMKFRNKLPGVFFFK